MEALLLQWLMTSKPITNTLMRAFVSSRSPFRQISTKKPVLVYPFILCTRL